MAIYHFCAKIIGRGSGRSAVAAAAYRAAERLYNNPVAAAAYRSGEELHSKHYGITFDYTRKKGVVYTEIILPDNAPEIFAIRNVLWNAVEQSEKRKDAQTAREVEVALPIEFTLQEQIELLQEYINDNFVSAGMCADYAIHDKEDGNPHAHIMLTTRHVTELGFGSKNRDWNKKSNLEEWRKNWAEICNERLQAKGLDTRIDHRSLEEQGLEREPTIHVGRSARRERENQEIIKRNERFLPSAVVQYMNELQEGYKIVDRHLVECSEKQREVDRLNHRTKDMTERAEEVFKKRTELAEAIAERNSMKFWESKRDIDDKINKLINSERNARDFFVQTFKVEFDAVPNEIQRNKAQAASLAKEIQGAHVERLSKVRNMIVIEYQKQKMLSEIRPDGKEILSRVKPPPAPLNHISKENYTQIISEIRAAQARILIEKYRDDMLRRKFRGRTR